MKEGMRFWIYVGIQMLFFWIAIYPALIADFSSFWVFLIVVVLVYFTCFRVAYKIAPKFMHEVFDPGL